MTNGLSQVPGLPGIWTAGPDDAPPLVLVHGIWLSARMWDPHAARLAPRFRVTAPDLPAHGALQGEQFTLEDAVARVDAAVAEASAATGRRPLVAGTSLGGYVALAYGAAHPGRIAALLVHGATARPEGFTGRVYRTAARAFEALGPERAARLADRGLRRQLPPESYRAAVSGGLAVRAFSAVVADLTRRDFLAVAAHVRVPVLLVNSRSDPLFRAQEKTFLRVVRESGGHVRLCHVKGHHVLPAGDPGAFARVLERGHRHLSEAVPAVFERPARGDGDRGEVTLHPVPPR
ncbi:alpha/beta hydrolase [Streptomyces morookaense]|uniref:alpha/beta fold hydrolase n=1 Tax=Streptomyces morookaense TaxID=1970 RepID=UPI0033D18C21